MFSGGLDTDGRGLAAVFLYDGFLKEPFAVHEGVWQARFGLSGVAVAEYGAGGDVEDSCRFLDVYHFRALLEHGVFYRFGDRPGDGGFQYFVEEGLKHI